MPASSTTLIAVSERVAAALSSGRPIVALETTLMTHGLPRPAGLETAMALEAHVRANGAQPATIGVLDGRVRVGLSEQEIERLAHAGDVEKLNLSNLAARAATAQAGSTTVAATIFAAHRAGIRVLATGGIGGVHRDVVDTGDISSDLTALARWPVAVVCAGAKAVLDLARTVEALETLGVPVYGFGTDQLPAFYRRGSGLAADARFDDVAALARAVRTHVDLGMRTGIVIGNPVPEEHEMPADVYARALSLALADATHASVRGRAVTPFLLDRLREITQDVSVFSNRALLEHNARVAARLAVALAVPAG
jgi:pseudouridylate synthase